MEDCKSPIHDNEHIVEVGVHLFFKILCNRIDVDGGVEVSAPILDTDLALLLESDSVLRFKFVICDLRAVIKGA